MNTDYEIEIKNLNKFITLYHKELFLEEEKIMLKKIITSEKEINKFIKYTDIK
ncbi:MAG: hypothetical protein PHV06_02085 [bacterium]|nr:hypothetical protein [bacterium]